MRNAEDVTFGSSGLDRAAHLRSSADNLAADPKARAVIFWRGKPLIDAAQQLILVGSNHPLVKLSESRIFLGMLRGTPMFAYDISNWSPPDNGADSGTPITHPDAPSGSSFHSIKIVLAHLAREDAELAVCAKGIFSWHRRHMFCANCGHPTEIVNAGWQRGCSKCGAQHFPRTDPVVIVLVTHGNNVLLGRSPGWPEKTYSLLAGFMEPGETIEAAARREIHEESGIRLGEVGYLASQPWPFPSSLMIGCWGIARNTDITLDTNELENAIWMSKEGIIEQLSGNKRDVLMARKGSIAQFLIENWIKGCIP